MRKSLINLEFMRISGVEMTMNDTYDLLTNRYNHIHKH